MKKLFVSAENAEFQIIESLKNNRVKRAKNNEIFIEGIESIKQVLKAGLEITRIITRGEISPWARGIIGRFENAGSHQEGPKLIEMAEDLYKKLCDKLEPSEMLVTAVLPRRTLDDLQLPENPFILVLDRASDTGNLGSIIRSANSLGIDAVLLLGHSVDPWDPKTIRASLGSIFFTTPIQLESLEELEAYIELLKARHSIEIWGTDSGGTSSLVSQTLKRPIMLILGNEAKGMSVALKNLCHGVIGIPLSGEVNSLNIASAASIFMWEVSRNNPEKWRP
jgi:TrmH family RNA methyltransferase